MTTQPTLDNSIPGSDLVAQGLQDIEHGRVSVYSLLLQVASPRLKGVNITIPPLASIPSADQIPYEHQLYDLLEGHGDYSLYNALLRRIASFAATLEAQETKSERST